MKTIFLLTLICTVLLATGCPKNSPNLDLSDNGQKAILINMLKDQVYKKEWYEYKCSNDGFYNTGLNDNNSFRFFTCGANLPKNSQTASNIRNEVLDNGVGLIDSVYGVYIRDIRKKRSIGEFLADLLQIGGSTAGGIVKGERPLQIIGVALTGFSAGRKSADLNFYDEKTTSILIKRMDLSRSQILNEIKQNQQKSTSDYSFDAGLDDIVRYFDAGTLNRAFTDLDKQTSFEAEMARKGVLHVKKIDDLALIPSIEEVKGNTDIFNELKLIDKQLANPDTRNAATERLKSIYKKITDEPKFKNTLDTLEKKATDPTQDPDGIFAERLKSTYVKIKNSPPDLLTPKDYFELVSGVFSIAGEAANKDELLKLLGEIFAKTK